MHLLRLGDRFTYPPGATRQSTNPVHADLHSVDVDLDRGEREELAGRAGTTDSTVIETRSA